MKIAFLAPDIDLNGFAGDVSHVEDLASALSRAGCFVELYVSNAGDWRPPPRVRVRSMTSRWTILSAIAIQRDLRGSPPEVIYERRGSPKLSVLLSLLLRRPVFVEIDGVPELEKAMLGEVERLPRWITALRQTTRSFLLRRAAGIVPVTQGLKDVLIRLHRIPPARITVVSNGVDPSVFYPRSRSDSRIALGLPAESPYLLFVGNLVRWQGVHTLVESMRQVVEQCPSVKLLVVGDGPESRPLRHQASEVGVEANIRFVGRVPREQVPVWIGAADICLMPSTLARNAEVGSAALKLREYLACGRPVIASDLPGAGPYLVQEKAGVAVPADDVHELAMAIIQLLKDPKTRSEFGTSAVSAARRDFSWDRIAVQLIGLFERQSFAFGS